MRSLLTDLNVESVGEVRAVPGQLPADIRHQASEQSPSELELLIRAVVHLFLQLEVLLLLLHLLQVPVVLVILPLPLLDGAPVGQSGLQAGGVPRRLQPGVGVPRGRGQDGHLPEAGVEAAEEAGSAGGFVGRGLAEDLVSEERAHSSA